MGHKNVILIRHAKSSWASATLQDHDRPLNKRGVRDAPIMADHFKRNIGFVPDMFLSSTARRAIDTAIYFKDALGINEDGFKLVEDLYHASSKDILNIISKQYDDVNTVMVVAHNPGVTGFVNKVTDEYIENIPTCGVAVVRFNTSKWVDIDSQKGKLIHYLYPKGI